MSFLFQNDLVFAVIFGLVIFVLCYLWIDKILFFLYDKSLGSREEIIDLMDKMFVEVDKQKITMLMLLGSFGVGAIVFLALWPSVIPGLFLGASVTVVGWVVPKLIIKNLWEKRCSKVVQQMVDGMTIMANGIKSGLSPQQSLERVVDNMGGPIAQEFKLVLNKMRLGLSLEESLNEFYERIPRDDVQMFVNSVNILSETGGNLAETFSTIAYTIRERQKIERKIEAMTASAVTQGIIITCVPFVIIGVFAVLDPDYIAPLFTKPLGWFALVLMLSLQIIGGLSMRKIVTIKV